MGNWFKRTALILVGESGPVVNLTAIQEPSCGSITLIWEPPTQYGDEVTSYDVRFKPIGFGAAHYTYAAPPNDLRKLEVNLTRASGLPPLTQCNFEVRARIQERSGQWQGVVQFVEWTCKMPECLKSRRRISQDHISEFCHRDHAKQFALKYCLYGECQEPKSREDGPQYHFCNLHHLRMAKLKNVTALLELNGPNEKFRELCKLFKKKWAKGATPFIRSVLEVVNPLIEERFLAYIESLPRRYRKIEQYFHGTSLSCNIVEDLRTCSDLSTVLKDCGACGIIENGFETSKISNRWQRFGPGFYLASNSSKSGDYCRGNGSLRAIFLCDVAPGKKHELRTSNPGLDAPPSDCHSVYGKSKFLGKFGDLNYDEMVLYAPDAIYPRYVFIV